MSLNPIIAAQLLTEWTKALLGELAPTGDHVSTHYRASLLAPSTIDLPLVLVHEGRDPIALIAAPAEADEDAEDPLVAEAVAAATWSANLRQVDGRLSALVAEGPTIRQWREGTSGYVTFAETARGPVTLWWTPAAPALLGWWLPQAGTRFEVRVPLGHDVTQDGLWVPEDPDAIPVHWRIGQAIGAGHLRVGVDALILDPGPIEQPDPPELRGPVIHLRAQLHTAPATSPFTLTAAATGVVSRRDTLLGHAAWVTDGDRLGVRIRLRDTDR